MEESDHGEACLARVEETGGALAAAQRAAVQDGLRSGTYTASPTQGGVKVPTTVLGQTLSGVVTAAGHTARVDLESVQRR